MPHRRRHAATSATARCRSSSARTRNADGDRIVSVGAHQLPRTGASRRSEAAVRIRATAFFDLLNAENADRQRREAERRSGRLQGQDRLRRRDRDRSVRRVRDAVFAAARCRACRSTRRSPTTSCRIVSRRAAATAARVAVVLALALAGRSGRDARCRRGGRRRYRRHPRALFAWVATRALRARLLAESVAAGAGVVGGALWRRRLPVLRRRPREAKDEAAVRAVRVEGRLRAAGRESRRSRASAASAAR